MIIAYIYHTISGIMTYFFGVKKSNSYEPFWLKFIVVIWAILVGINDKK